MQVQLKVITFQQAGHTLSKSQRTRGLSSYHKFKHKSWSNFIFRISTKHQLQLQPNISISTKSSIKLQNLDQISTKIQFHNLYKTSAEKNCPNSSFKSCLNFKILTKPCAQSISKSLTFFYQTSASKSATNCCQQDPHQQQLQHQQVLSWHLQTPGLHQSSLLNVTESVSQLVSYWQA